MSNIQVFNYEQNEIRTVEHEGGIWFVAKDVCDVLGFGNPRQAINTHIDDDEKDVQNLDTPGGVQQMTIINESGLYTLALRSNKPNAKQFRKWVTGTVLPSIRKTGFYATPDTAQKIINDPDTFIKVLQELKSQQEKAQLLEAKINDDRPKVIFAEAVNSSNDSILIGNLAKILRQNGVNIGQNRLFAWLRDNGYLIKKRGALHNMPTQSSMDKGYFEVKTTIIHNPDGSTRITRTTKVTGKGQVYFVNLFLSENVVNV